MMLFHLAFLVPLATASSLTSTPSPKPTVDISPLTSAISTLPFDIPHTTGSPQVTTHAWPWPYPPRHYDKREDLTRLPTLTFHIPHTTKPPKETTHTWAWPYSPSSLNKREGSTQTRPSSTPSWTTLTSPQPAVSTRGADNKAIIGPPTISHPPQNSTLPSSAQRLSVPRILLPFLYARSIFASTILPSQNPFFTTSTIHETPAPTTSFTSSNIPPTSTIHETPAPTTSFTSSNIPPTSTSFPSALPPASFRECPDHHQNCGAEICYDPMVSWCCPGKMNVCGIRDVCAAANSTVAHRGKDGVEIGWANSTVYGCGPQDVTDGLDSRISTMTNSLATSKTTGPGASSVPTNSIVSSSAFQLRVPRILLPLFYVRSVFASTSTILPRQKPLPTGSTIATPTPAPTTPFTSVDIPPTFTPTPRPPGSPRECTDNHQNCGLNICYDPEAWLCCPGERNVCKIEQVCVVQANITTGGEGAVFGCGPEGVHDGSDSSISAGTTSRIDTPTATIITKAATTTTMTMTGHTTISTSVGSAGNKLGAPRVFGGIVALVHVVRAVSSPTALRPECCGDICCAQGEVCARSSEGAKCWPAASRRGIVGIEEERTEQDGVVHMSGSPQEEHDQKGGGRGGGGGGAAAAGGGDKSGSSARPVVRSLLYLFLLLVPFAVASLPASFSLPASAGTAQLDPSLKEHLQTRWSLSKRWSCHKPKMECGANGCFEPNVHWCCKNHDGSFGLCEAGCQVCCGNMCCGKDMACNNIKGEYLCKPNSSAHV